MVSEMERVAIVDSGLLSHLPISDSPSMREGRSAVASDNIVRF